MCGIKLIRSLIIVALALPLTLSAATSAILGWNNLGMHCMDSDYSVFSILPPYNTIEAQLIVGGKLITNGAGYTVTYQAVADPDGSFNSTAMGKGNYYTYASSLFGANLAPEGGLAGWSMPGTNNVPQSMLFEAFNHPAPGVATPVNWFRAEGIPLSPYDDAHKKNPYPLMRLIASIGGVGIATNDVVLPVSDEMDCRACHASGTGVDAKPAAGWVWNGLPERDYRLNILRLHDEKQFSLHPGLYAAALAARGFNPSGLYRGVVADGKPVLCAICHASEALGLGSYSNIPPLTASVHARHAAVMDPVTHMSMDSSANRSACYRCHPGSATRCLRGAMGGAVAADGSMEMQCQSCHGSMSTVGDSRRVGWFMEPRCDSCHTGTATQNNGQIRYTSSFQANGTPRVAINKTFATTDNIPAAGLSLYRFSIGHGGLQCSACHGSTHAEFPSTHRNDNLRNIELPYQGHVGVVSECLACHVTTPITTSGGPHGMHPIGQTWVSRHPDLVQSSGSAQCQACHGADYRGTVLSRALGDRTLTAFSTTINLYRGAVIGCYTCHNGPGSESANPSVAPTANNVTANTTNGHPVAISLGGSGGTVRVITQPAHGSVAWTNRAAVYYPEPGYSGIDTFTFAAFDGSKNSLLATGIVSVVAGGPSTYSISATANVPPTYPAGWTVAFGVMPALSNASASVTFDWNFGDGSQHSTNQFAAHAYTLPGSYPWTVVSTVSTVSVTNTGTIVISGPVGISSVRAANLITFSWPNTIADVVLEGAPQLGPVAMWTPVTNSVNTTPGFISVTVPSSGNEFFRLRRQW